MLSDMALFSGYRPLIRRGADYMVLQHCIYSGIELKNQKDFDFQENQMGDEKMDQFHQYFYAARGNLLRQNRKYWLSLNTLYPGLKSILKKNADSSIILTTKEVDFVAEILTYNGIAYPKKQIFCSGKESKIQYIKSVLAQSNYKDAIFIDDQIDHFLSDRSSRIQCFLASWGYVKPEWLVQNTIEVLELKNLETLLGRFF